MSDAKKNVKLIWNGKEFEYPVIEGSEKEFAFDISKLRDQTGLVTMDNGFANTSTCESAITFLDGEKGVLRYRGIPIEQLAEKSNFLETAFLLLEGRLPTKEEWTAFQAEVLSEASVPENIAKLIQSFPRETHPMAILSAALNALSGFYPKELAPSNKEHNWRNILRLMGKMPALTALAYHHVAGTKAASPKLSGDYCENFLHLMFWDKYQGKQPPKEVIEAMHLLLILHADHEQNCSTSAVRLVGSSAANVYASVAAGVCALWGPLHGGANQSVMEMLEEIQKGGGDVDRYVALAKDKNSSFRLMGFGHRVYKNFDPRAAIIKQACDRVLNKLNIRDPLLDIARRLEAAALKDAYFKERKLYPNVDFYSGIIYRALGIPVSMFTPMFALGRMPGWLAHWKEMTDGGVAKIGRPRQIYTGPVKTEYAGIDSRGGWAPKSAKGGKKGAA